MFVRFSGEAPRSLLLGWPAKAQLTFRFDLLKHLSIIIRASGHDRSSKQQEGWWREAFWGPKVRRRRRRRGRWRILMKEKMMMMSKEIETERVDFEDES